MFRKTLLLLSLFFALKSMDAQTYPSAVPELQIAYYGEFMFHPGAKVGLSLPFSEWTKERPQQTKRRGKYAIVKQKEFRLGSNLSFYNIPRNHTGYLLNAELTYRRSKFYSFRPEKKGQLEYAIGLGYFRYSLHGTTFRPDGGSFKEINGNGGAFMPSVALSWGGNFRWKDGRNGRYFIKPVLLAEIPFGTGLQLITVVEAGIAIPLDIKGFDIQKNKK